MKIVKASEEQLIELAGLQRRYMEYHEQIDEYFAFKDGISELWIEYMKEVIKDENQIAFCALVENRIVGYITARTTERPPIYRIGRVGLIGDAFVLPEFRKQGIFSQLLEKAIEWMKKKGIDHVEHPVASKNEQGLKVWRNKGFKSYIVFLRKQI